MTRVFATAEFSRFAKKARLADAALVEAVERAERGLADADLGGGVVKLRIGRPNEGRAGGFRTIVALIVDRRAFFLFGYAKNQMDNIRDGALDDFRDAGAFYQRLDEERLRRYVADGTLREIRR